MELTACARGPLHTLERPLRLAVAEFDFDPRTQVLRERTVSMTLSSTVMMLVELRLGLAPHGEHHIIFHILKQSLRHTSSGVGALCLRHTSFSTCCNPS